ncbi:oxidoreductase [Agrobacterium rhizogenes]|uniref:PDR/VanB family oxidoreductase n=1 Tax=Rhizobium rhizogenes TaxID=359 RepID=UPI00157312AF|nr:PDR/VanB family oxidoreductase [Rhizobium rhizogenes]NTH16720.1 oxidoreductase [Rhizobium rhizogenes]
MSQWIEVRISSRIAETRAISTFELRQPDGRPLPQFTAGAHIDVKIDDGLIRQYSLCNDAIERHRYVIGVLNEPQSRGGSRIIHETFHQDRIISISPPRNHFELDIADDHYILLAGGIGLTPILSMAAELHRQSRSFEVHYCARSRGSAAFLSHLNSAEYSGRVFCHFDDEDNGQKLDPAKLFSRVHKARQLYVCGPKGFMDWIVGSAEQAGIENARIHREYFTAAPQENREAGTFEVVIASTGQTFIIPPEKSIVRVLEENGVEVLVSCEQGICGSCITTILEGTPDHRDSVLTEGERQAGTLFTPCCSRAKTARLVLDL